MSEYGFSLTHIFLYMDRIFNSENLFNLSVKQIKRGETMQVVMFLIVVIPTSLWPVSQKALSESDYH